MVVALVGRQKRPKHAPKIGAARWKCESKNGSGGTEAANLFLGEVYSRRLSGSEKSLLSLYRFLQSTNLMWSPHGAALFA